MSKSKYVDTSAIINVLAGVYTTPSILDNETYHFNEEDFSANEFHKVLFGTIYNLQGIKVDKPEKGNLYIKNGKKFRVK